MPLVTESLDFIMSFDEPSLEVGQILPNESEVRSFTRSIPSVRETAMTSIRRKAKKFVQFRTVTVYYFPRAHGYSSIPSEDGPSLGMSNKHVLVETFDLMGKFDLVLNDHHLHLEHPRLSAFTGLTDKDGLLASIDSLHNGLGQVGGSILPIPMRQRRKLLRDAGVAKVDAVEEAEVKEIRISRTLCGCNCKDICRPSTCLCSRSEIPCQVDGGSFPCACSKFGCGNPAGRIQFNLAQVKEQRFLQLARLGVDSASDLVNPTLDVLNVELIISPAKRAKLSNLGPARKRGVALRRPARRKTGMQPSAWVPEKRGRLLDGDVSVTDASAAEHDGSFDGDQLITDSRTQFREAIRESSNASSLESVDAVVDTPHFEPNSTGIEDVGTPHDATSCSRRFDHDPVEDLEVDLDLNRLKLLGFGSENLEETVGDFERRDDCGSKYLGSILVSGSQSGCNLGSSNDLQSAIEVDLELGCEVVESNNDFQSTDGLDLDLRCDISLSCQSPQPTVNRDAVSTSAAVQGHDAQSSDVVEMDFSNERDLDTVVNDLDTVGTDLDTVGSGLGAIGNDPDTVGNGVHAMSNDPDGAFDIDSAHSCPCKPKEQSVSCRSFLSRFLQNNLQNTDVSDPSSDVTKSCETHKSQGHIVDSEGHKAVYEGHMTNFEGHMTDSQGHHINSEGRYVESQCNHVNSQEHFIECQGHLIESQGHLVESQGHWNVPNPAQVTEPTSIVTDTCADDSDICDLATQSDFENPSFRGSQFDSVALQETSSMLKDVSSTQPDTLNEESSPSEAEVDLNPHRYSNNNELHINLDDDLRVVTRAGSLLEAGSKMS